jgi:hypothetical protein
MTIENSLSKIYETLSTSSVYYQEDNSQKLMRTTEITQVVTTSIQSDFTTKPTSTAVIFLSPKTTYWNSMFDT